MNPRRALGSAGRAVAVMVVVFHATARIAAQAPMPMPAAHQMSMGAMTGPLDLGDNRNGSGTSWLPDDTPMRGPMLHRGGWMIMWHWNGFLQDIDATGARGDRQLGSVNWFMTMAERSVGGGQLRLNAMLSAEPLTVGRCGFPDLAQSGELCRGDSLHDRQHPHDLFMELTADYRRAISKSLAVEVYGGPVGEPALGPVAFPHRPSAQAVPIAPITHHWLDSTHVSFGVVTGGLYGRSWKAEGSAFNGREPDDRRYNIDLDRLDSYSGRFSVLPTPHMSLQVSGGRLTGAEQHADGSRSSLTRLTASATFDTVADSRLWATTVAFGRDQGNGRSTFALLAETAAEVTPHDTLFARSEVAQKTSADLALTGIDGIFRITKVEVGYTRWLGSGRHARIGAGVSAGLLFVPEALAAVYGHRATPEYSIFLNVGPF
jgi:hypothetical protein